MKGADRKISNMSSEENCGAEVMTLRGWLHALHVGTLSLVPGPLNTAGNASPLQKEKEK